MDIGDVRELVAAILLLGGILMILYCALDAAYRK